MDTSLAMNGDCASVTMASSLLTVITDLVKNIFSLINLCHHCFCFLLLACTGMVRMPLPSQLLVMLLHIFGAVWFAHERLHAKGPQGSSLSFHVKTLTELTPERASIEVKVFPPGRIVKGLEVFVFDPAQDVPNGILQLDILIPVVTNFGNDL